MAFLVEADLHTVILSDELTEITRGDNTVLESALSAAVEEMRTYLYDAFDVDTIFAETGDDRHRMLVKIGSDIAVWFLYARVQAGQSMEDRRQRYDRAINWLKQVQKSGMYADLPRRESTVQTHLSVGSNNKRNNHY